MVARGLTWSHKRVTRKSADTRRNSASCECSDLANCNTTCREQETSTRRTKGEVRSRSIHNFMHLRRTILLSPTVWSLKTNKRLPLWGCCLLSGVGGSACVWGSPLPSDPSSFQARLLLFRTTNSDGMVVPRTERCRDRRLSVAAGRMRKQLHYTQASVLCVFIG